MPRLLILRDPSALKLPLIYKSLGDKSYLNHSRWDKCTDLGLMNINLVLFREEFNVWVYIPATISLLICQEKNIIESLPGIYSWKWFSKIWFKNSIKEKKENLLFSLSSNFFPHLWISWPELFPTSTCSSHQHKKRKRKKKLEYTQFSRGHLVGKWLKKPFLVVSIHLVHTDGPHVFYLLLHWNLPYLFFEKKINVY